MGKLPLPLELELRVLSWVPAEDVARLQLVCKDWGRLLHDPTFRALWERQNGTSYFLLHVKRHARDSLEVQFRYCKYDSSEDRVCLQQVPPSLRSWFAPDGSEPLLAGGGLILCWFPKVSGSSGLVDSTNRESHFLVGNPLTQEWVKIPGVEVPLYYSKRMLTTYFDEGQMFFRIWLEPYSFDSKVGIWTVPRAGVFEMCSYNSVCIKGVHYALARLHQYAALVLLEVDFADISRSKWAYAWDLSELEGTYEDVYMLEVGPGEIGIFTQKMEWMEYTTVMVLDRQQNDDGDSEWTWKTVSTSPEEDFETGPGIIQTSECQTHGKDTFCVAEKGIVRFDSQNLTWEWVEKGQHLERVMEKLLLLEPNLAAVPNLNVPSLDLKSACASRFRKVCYVGHPVEHEFSDLKALWKPGLSWREIGEVAIDWKEGVLPLEATV
ncbi:hypothetical protein SELMODRAFT_413145 [Selaginella moellendorffii]|uniref:F-box domain-containing protein n=1 Tax=Selaginella moellendorffii TaxID=88036 RepID=D8RNH7_SELML|nr:hypothetical protein SELMODRAFT_413145 [Selaginella moellendorffii]